MNANELLEIGEHLQSLNDDNLAQRVLDGTEVQNFIGGSLEILSRTRIRVTATEPPTEKDGGTGNHAPYVMARENKHDFWEEIELEWVANHPDEYTEWTCVPQLPEVTP